jgi:hypothetical protein
MFTAQFPPFPSFFLAKVFLHGRMARGGHGLPGVSPRPATPYPFTPGTRAKPETAICGPPTGRVTCAVYYPFGHPTPYAVSFFIGDTILFYGAKP